MPEGDTLYRAAVTLRKALLNKTITRFDSVVDTVIATNRRHPIAGRVVSAVEARGKNLLIVFRENAPSVPQVWGKEEAHALAAELPEATEGIQGFLAQNLEDRESTLQTGSSPSDPITTPAALHLDLIRSDMVLHTHLRMTGSWHIYRPGETWRKPVRYAKAVLSTEDFVAPCFSAPVVELMTARETVRNTGLTELGSDAMTTEFDPEDVLRKMRRHLEVPIGVVIMNQRVMAGVGNEFKSEIFFIQRVNPFLLVGDLSDETLNGLIAKSHALLRLNANHGRRRTMFHLDGAKRVWVYGRSGSPCYVCGAPIKMRRQGLDGRSTYYCPQCQCV